MQDTLLIDECLSQQLVAVAKERGVLAEHIALIGKAGWQDHSIVRLSLERSYTLVTNNRRDFLEDIHNGLVVLGAHRRRFDQVHSFGGALHKLDELGADRVNTLLEVSRDGTVHVREWTRSRHDPDHIRSPDWR